MSTQPPSHRKSRSGSSFFRRSSLPLSTASSSTGDKSPSVPSSPARKTGSAASRLACLTIPTSDSSDSNDELSENSAPVPIRFSTKLPISDSPTRSPVAPSSPVGVGGRQSLSRRGTRPNSTIFGSFKSLRFAEEYSPGAAQNDGRERRTSSYVSRDSSGREDANDMGKNRTVLHHGEAQTNTGLFWKKREYLVLTESHLVRCKSQSRALDLFHSLPVTGSRGSISRHGSSPSIDSERDFAFALDNSGERAAAIPLEYLVAIYQPDDSKHVYTLEISYLDKELAQGSSITLQLADADSRDAWLKSLRRAANTARLLDGDPIPQRLSEYAARVVEREQDYDPTRFRIYKIAKRASVRSGNRSSIDDTQRLVPTVCFLAIGVHKVHIIGLPKGIVRQSSPALADLVEAESFGILTLTWISVNEIDDSFALSFRFPLKPAQSLQLSSLAAQEIALRLRHSDTVLRPEWVQRPFAFVVPAKFEEQYIAEESTHGEDHNCFDRTLTAFAVAYNVNPSNIRYTISYTVEDSPRFELLEPAHSHAPQYSVLELLAVFRALRCNESFTTLSFSGIQLDALNELTDPHGLEHICITSKHGSPTGLTIEEQQGCSLLVQELRALALGSNTLRRLDFSNCLSNTLMTPAITSRTKQRSCGILEALSPLCKGNFTQVDWLVLTGIELHERDVSILLDLAADRRCHLRAIELRSCGLGEDVTALLVDAFRAQGRTLEALDISHNKLRVNPGSFSRLLFGHGNLRKLDLSGLTALPSDQPLLTFQTLSAWDLEHLRLAGILLNDASVEALCRYLNHPHSQVLYELDLSRCSLTGGHVADLMTSMTQELGIARYLHLDVSDNSVQKDHHRLIEAVGKGLAPTHLSMRGVEYDTDEQFRTLLVSLSGNRSIRYLDISCVSLPAEASEDSCQALKHLLAENCTLEEFDISGEHSRLEVTKVGGGIRQALRGLEYNNTLQILRIHDQRLGRQGAAILAEVLKVNTCLREIHCENNEITLSGFTDLVNALVDNTTVQYLPALEEGKHAAIAQTKQQIKDARTKADGTVIHRPSSDPKRLQSVRRTLVKGSNNPPVGGKSGFTGRLVSVPQWTETDVNAALRLVSEGWESQAERLRRFLERNWRLASGTPREEAEILAGLRERAMDDIPVPGEDATVPGVASPSRLSLLQASPSLSGTEERPSSARLSGPVTELSPVFERAGFNLGASPNSGLGLGLEMGDVDRGAGFGTSGTGMPGGALQEANVGADAYEDGESLELKIPVRSRER